MYVSDYMHGFRIPFVQYLRVCPAAVAVFLLLGNFKDAKADIQLVRIPAGHYKFGADPNNDLARPNEFSQKQVTVAPFWVAKTEVTNKQFELFVVATGYMTSAEKQGLSRSWRDYFGVGEEGVPVIIVSWEDSQAYCRWASSITGCAVRLPTEVEWEYLCNRTEVENRGRARDRSEEDPVRRQVNTSIANEAAIDGIRGNVAELCQDIYTEPTTASSSDDLRVLKGVAYSPRKGDPAEPVATAACSHRVRVRSDVPGLYFGFRIVYESEVNEAAVRFSDEWNATSD